MKKVTQIAEFELNEVMRLLRQTDWGPQRPPEVMEKAMQNSLNFGLMGDDGKLLAYARVVTDKATYAYLCDVVVDEPERGKGYSKSLMQCVMEAPELQGLRRFSLLTGNAHGLYSQYGFAPKKDAMERYMEIFQNV